MSTDSKLAEQSRRIAACQRVMDLIDAYVERPNAGNRLSIREGLWELAAHSPNPASGASEQEQAGEAVVGEAGTMPGTSGFTMACFHADKVPLGTKLYTRPLEPLTQTKLIALWADKSDGPSNAEIVSFARAIERAHGITKEPKT